MLSSKKSHLLAAAAFMLTLGVALAASAEGAGQYISDAAITAKVKANIMSDKMMKASDVSVETTEGVVQLTGSVNSKDQEQEAVDTARQVKGVKSVKSMLQVGAPQFE